MPLTLQSKRKLNDGNDIPVLGLGVFQASPGRTTQGAVLAALELGYRHIDTAALYGNERDVGEAIRRSDIGRKNVFVTSKLWNAEHGYDRAMRACDRSLDELGFGYLDLYLIHWPVQGARADTWRALEAMKAAGKCRSIGVSNYMTHHLTELTGHCKVMPAVDQVELSPFLQQRELRTMCHGLHIEVEAYSPLTRGRRLKDPTVVKVARRHGRSPAQVLIRWALQKDVVVIPKSIHRDRIAENAAVFDFTLSEADLAALDSLEEELHVSWDPTDIP
ncbi:MAG: aldo/keto reductase [Myxococcaceae bacterium]